MCYNRLKLKRGACELSKNFNTDYMQDVLIRLAHHSSAIEGNTISLPDTVELIENDTIPKNSGQSIREIFEVINHKKAFEFFNDSIYQEKKLTTHTVREMHRLLTDRLQHDSGSYKQSSNVIRGASFETASPQETPYLMEQLIDNYHFQIDRAESDCEKLKTIAEMHINFERIHPFSDGNGRTGRMILNYALAENNFSIIVIEKDEKASYLHYLNNQDSDGFAQFIEAKVKYETNRQKQFANSEKQQISDAELEEKYGQYDLDDLV